VAEEPEELVEPVDPEDPEDPEEPEEVDEVVAPEELPLLLPPLADAVAAKVHDPPPAIGQLPLTLATPDSSAVHDSFPVSEPLKLMVLPVTVPWAVPPPHARAIVQPVWTTSHVSVVQPVNDHEPPTSTQPEPLPDEHALPQTVAIATRTASTPARSLPVLLEPPTPAHLMMDENAIRRSFRPDKSTLRSRNHSSSTVRRARGVLPRTALPRTCLDDPVRR
jgi:hypothetical protein